MLLVTTFALCCFALATPTSASAALSFPFSGELSSEPNAMGFVEIDGIAVDDENNDVYVADSTAGLVRVFDTSHHEVGIIDGSTTPAGSLGGSGATIYVAARNSGGDVFVLDATHGVVDVFSDTSAYICQITGSVTPSTTECNGGAGSATPSGGFGFARGVAVDQSSGEIDILDPEHGAIDRFTAGGAFTSQIKLAPAVTPASARGIAVDGATGDVYVDDSFPAEVAIFENSGSFVEAWTGGNTPSGEFAGEVSAGVDEAAGRVYVTDPQHGVTNVFKVGGAFVGQFSHEYVIPHATAVGQASGQVYIANLRPEGAPSNIEIFGPAEIVPDVTTEAATNISAHAATLHGLINPDGVQLESCEFEYGATTSYGYNAPCVPSAAATPPDETAHSVEAAITGLQAGTTYHFRLRASNPHGGNVGLDMIVTSLPTPVLTQPIATDLTPSTATLSASINPEGSETEYRFEWGESTAYESAGPERSLPAGSNAINVTEPILGLNPGVHYYWRITATNKNGATTGEGHSFSYDEESPALPDGRRYEMVTPVHKNAALIGSGLLLISPSIAEGGNTVEIASIQCLAGAMSCTGTREQEGEPYSFTRTASGWVTLPLAPPATAAGGNTLLLSNATTGVSLFSMPSVPGQGDELYRRTATGEFQAIGPATPPEAGALGAGYTGLAYEATDDMTHVVYQLDAPLWPFDESRGQVSLYEYSGTGNKAPRLVAVEGPEGSTTLLGHCGAQLAGVHALSATGEYVYVTVIGHDIGTSACPTGAEAPPVFGLYLRRAGKETVNISQRAAAECTTSGCITSPPGDAQFEDASSDGRQVLFTDTQQLTDGATEDAVSGDSAARNGGCPAAVSSGCNLYEYDSTLPSGHNLIDMSEGDRSGSGPRVQRVLAMSNDGSHVYFVARGELTATANSEGATPQRTGENLYCYERDTEHPTGRLRFVATLSPIDKHEHADVTPDGRYLVFTSHASLTADDTSVSSAAQVYRYEAVSEKLTRLSSGVDGFDDNGNTYGAEACTTFSCPLDASVARAFNGETRRDTTMSNDGQYIFFSSPVGLTPQALNKVEIGEEGGAPVFAQNVYEYHAGRVWLISDGKDTSATYQVPRLVGGVELVGTDATGENVFFTTADQLVPQDTDTQIDYYDARIGGGFPASIVPHECASGDECRGPGNYPPTGGTPGSAAYMGPGNVAAPATEVAPKEPKMLASRAAKLKLALRRCRAMRVKVERRKCERAARSRYGVKRKGK